MKNYYYILGVERNATDNQIKLAFKKLAMKFHPDKNDGDKFFEERFKEIQEAFATLSNELDRRKYDILFDAHIKNTNHTHNNNAQFRSYEAKVKNDFENELKQMKRRLDEELARQKSENENKIRQAQEETKRKYQTNEQRIAEEKEQEKQKIEYEKQQQDIQKARRLEELKKALKDNEATLNSLNNSISKKQQEISQIRKEIDKEENQRTGNRYQWYHRLLYEYFGVNKNKRFIYAFIPLIIIVYILSLGINIGINNIICDGFPENTISYDSTVKIFDSLGNSTKVILVNNGEATWGTANCRIKNSTWQGYKDWRLPTMSELYQINKCKNKFDLLPNDSRIYWSSSDTDGMVNCISFKNGTNYLLDKEIKANIIAVRIQ